MASRRQSLDDPAIARPLMALPARAVAEP